MAKKCIFYVLLVILLVAMLPLLCGIVAKKKCRGLVELVNLSPLIETRVIRYDRGWFSSHATLELFLNGLDISQDFRRLVVYTRIKHGPFAINWSRFHFVQAMATARFVLSPEQSFMLKRESDYTIATARIRFKINGIVKLHFTVPKFTHGSDEQMVTMDGMQWDVVFSKHYGTVVSNFSFLGATGVISGHEFSLGEIKSDYRGEKEANGLWIGERILRLKSGKSKNANGHGITFKNFFLSNSIAAAGKNVVNFALAATLDELAINNMVYGTNNLNFEVTNLNKKLLGDIQKSLFSSAIALSPGSIFVELLFSLLGNGSEIKIVNSNSYTPWGKFSLDANVMCDISPQTMGWLATLASSKMEIVMKTEKAFLLYVLEKFYKNISSVGDALIPAIKSRETLDDFAKSGKIFSDDAGVFNITIEYKNKQMLVNGKPLVISVK